MQTEDIDIIELVLPDEQHRRAVLEYKEEFQRAGETLHGGAGLEQADTFDDWLRQAKRAVAKETVSDGRVPATVFLACKKSDGVVVGIIDLRHELNDYLLAQGGHVGYSVRKSERRKGYATQMLGRALDFYREHGTEKVLVTCDKDNIGSAKVITACGGQLENETIADNGKELQRYWILL